MFMEKYIGTVEVCSSDGFDTLGSAAGAFVNVVCLLDSADQFDGLVRSTMTEYHLDVVGIRDVGLVSERISRSDLIPELNTLANGLSPEFPIQFDEFQTYKGA
jgi:hypothetical protein